MVTQNLRGRSSWERGRFHLSESEGRVLCIFIEKANVLFRANAFRLYS